MQAAIRKILSSVIFLSAFLFLVSSFLFLVNSAHAQSPCTYDPNATDQEVFNEFNKCAIERDVFDSTIFNAGQIWATIDSLNLQLLGVSALHPETNDVTAGHGALAYASTLTASLYGSPPASGVLYFAGEIQKFNPIQPIYAQQEGAGYKALTPVQELWTVFRNASYVGFVIVFVIIGFMVMFRAHISPQAVATVQDSIPRIVIALILVTFSYAIAGLMLDIMFLSINIVIQLLAQSGVIDANVANDRIFNRNIISFMMGAWDDIFGATAQTVRDLLKTVNFAGPLTGLLSWGIGGIAALIVGIAALFIMFRILLMLLMAYVMIIILTLAAPFFFLIQALPGNNGAKEWFKQIGANVAVFPAVALMIILAGAIGDIAEFGGTGTGALKDIGQEALKFPLLVGGIPTDKIGKLIALGFLFMTPEAANLVKKMFKAEGVGIGGAGASSLAAGFGVASFPARAAVSRYNERRRAEAFRDVLNPRPREPTGQTEPGAGTQH